MKIQDHYCYYLPSSLTGISEEDCRMWYGRDGLVDIASPLFNLMPELLLDMMKACDKDIRFMSDYDNQTGQYGCYFQQQFRHPMNRKNPNSPTIRESIWNAYLNVVNRTNLQILDSATVLKLLFDQTDPTKYIGVSYEYKGEVRTAIARKEVILCAGVFNTPKLLKLSGVGPETWLEPLSIKVVAKNAEIGKHFADQMAIYMAFKTTEQVPALP
ncbi:unnamed protein product [Rotaria sp. Silwood2]|nr:unnamed protein product [Rotaria sp. Silwood2]CAF4196205.1 unnamed protein product [Rotaria sp. Silwood2]